MNVYVQMHTQSSHAPTVNHLPYNLFCICLYSNLSHTYNLDLADLQFSFDLKYVCICTLVYRTDVYAVRQAVKRETI